MSRSLAVIGVIVIIAGAIFFGATFTVLQTQQALVLRLGEPRRVIKEPGLKFKTPFIENVEYFERRILDLDPPQQQVILADQKRLNVDSYARFRITDPLLFFKRVRNESGARSRLGTIINSTIRQFLGNETLLSILSNKRIGIMTAIREQVNAQAQKELGIDVVEVRLRRADYPEETSQTIYDRMKSEREREAREFRAEGFEEAQKIRADAEKQKVVIVAEAKKNAETLRGKGDADAIKIYAYAFGQDPDFFAFYRSMQAYRNAMSSGDTTMVLSPNSDFFRYFKDMGGAKPAN